MFSFGSNHEAGYVLDKEQWGFVAVTSVYEIGDLLGGLSIYNSSKSRLPSAWNTNHPSRVCNDANLNPADLTMPTNHFFRKVRLEFIQAPRIKYALKNVAHVIGLPVILG